MDQVNGLPIGNVRDQAQLYGLLDRLQKFGIELLTSTHPHAFRAPRIRLVRRTALLASAWFGPVLLVTSTMCERRGAANLTCGGLAPVDRGAGMLESGDALPELVGGPDGLGWVAAKAVMIVAVTSLACARESTCSMRPAA